MLLKFLLNTQMIWMVFIINMEEYIITQSYFAVPKTIRLNSAHYFIMKILNNREHLQIAYNHSSDIDFKDFKNLYKNVLQNHIIF